MGGYAEVGFTSPIGAYMIVLRGWAQLFQEFPLWSWPVERMDVASGTALLSPFWGLIADAWLAKRSCSLAWRNW